MAKLRQIRKNADIPTLETIWKSLLEPIFLYNSELWSLTKTREKKVDVMQRKFIRILLSIKLIDKIKNEELYRRGERNKIERIRSKIRKWNKIERNKIE